MQKNNIKYLVRDRIELSLVFLKTLYWFSANFMIK